MKLPCGGDGSLDGTGYRCDGCGLIYGSVAQIANRKVCAQIESEKDADGNEG